MNVGLIDVDSHNFPNLALMKISAHHKQQGHKVDWLNGFVHYDIAYASRVFTDEYSSDHTTLIQADVIHRGGTGYGLGNRLPDEIEHTYPDYSLYPALTKGTAYGFLTRGCPRACGFCIVAAKEGRQSRQVADLSEFWRGQRRLCLLDPNLLAAQEHEALLQQLASTNAWVDFNQGLDIRLLNRDNATLLQHLRIERLHFAWDNPTQDLTPHFSRFKELAPYLVKARRCMVYILTNYNSTHEQDMYRITTLRDMGYLPYVMIYNKPSAPDTTRLLQRWVNNKRIFATVPDFNDYSRKIG